MKREPHIRLPKKRIEAFCRKHHIRRLSFFGSVLRDDFSADSDVDVLVDFQPGHSPSFFRLFAMQDELSEILGGRNVDMRTPNDLSRYFRDEVIRNAVVQYAS